MVLEKLTNSIIHTLDKKPDHFVSTSRNSTRSNKGKHQGHKFSCTKINAKTPSDFRLREGHSGKSMFSLTGKGFCVFPETF